MKAEKNSRIGLTVFIDRGLARGLLSKSLELSFKKDQKVTRSMVVEKALIKFGVKPCSKE